MSRPDLDHIVRDLKIVFKRMYSRAEKPGRFQDDVIALDAVTRVFIRALKEVPPEVLRSAATTEEIKARLDGNEVQFGLNDA